jgi:hypothetical protein
MKRRLLNLLTLLSLLVCVAVSVLWVRSYWVADMFVTARNAVGSCLGKLALLRSYGTEEDNAPAARGLGRYDPDNLNLQIGLAFQGSREWAVGDACVLLDGDRAGGTVLVVVPDWAVVLLTAAVPVARAVRLYRRRRWTPGRCRGCGYDLRATPDRCPECGAPATTPPSSIPSTAPPATGAF